MLPDMSTAIVQNLTAFHRTFDSVLNHITHNDILLDRKGQLMDMQCFAYKLIQV